MLVYILENCPEKWVKQQINLSRKQPCRALVHVIKQFVTCRIHFCHSLSQCEQVFRLQRNKMTSRDDWNPLTWKQNSELWIGIKFTKPSWQTAPVRCLMYIGLNDLSSSVPLLHVHTEPDSYSCQHKKLFGIVQTLKKYNSKYFAFSD